MQVPNMLDGAAWAGVEVSGPAMNSAITAMNRAEYTNLRWIALSIVIPPFRMISLGEARLGWCS